MILRQLGKTDLLLSPIGLGTYALGGTDWAYGWGPQDDRDSINTMCHAVEMGINWIDTAPVYGLGHAETIVSKALKEMPKSPFIATKCGLVWDDHRRVSNNLSSKSLIQEAEQSLKRLGVDVIDLYQIHWPHPKDQIEMAWETMQKLKEQGKIRYAAVSNFSVQMMERLHEIHPISSLQPPYSLLERRVEEEILPYCGENGIGVLPYSPMQKGLLSGKMSFERIANFPDSDHRKRDPQFQEPQISIHLELVDALKEVAACYDKTAAQLAIAWILMNPEITSAIVGARNPDQIEETIQASEWELDSMTINEVNELLQTHQDKLRSLAK